MTRLPRDLTGEALAKALSPFGYVVSRQTGSHMRLTTQERGEHHVTTPRHDPLRVGTLGAVLSEVAAHLEMSKEDIVDRLFG
jgi:predicted RNA binding protein YcfA (HicA-like mRNA interferase family)